jgi:uncharacterized membrane protein YcaP (DUF421 family)
MWHDMLSLGPTVAEKILRAFFIYGFLLVALRIGGKRELGQLNTMDFVVLLAVANAVQNGIIGNDNSVTGAVIGAATLFVINGVASIAVSKSRRLRMLLVGSPTPLIESGIVNERNLRRLRMTSDDVLQAVIEAGGESFSDVERCVIEPNGHVAVSLVERDASAAQLAAVKAQLDRIEAFLQGR